MKERKVKDHEKVLDICRRIERVLQRDWGGSGEGLRQSLGSTQYVVPADLDKRIRYLHGLQKKAKGNHHFKLKSSEDFLAKGEQVIKELALARNSAKRRLLPWLRELALRYRIILAVAAVALVAALVGAYLFVFQPEPPPPPLPTPAPKRVPKPAPKPAAAPAPVAAPAPAAKASAPATAPAPAAAAPAAPASATAVVEPAPGPAGVKVHVETPPEVIVTLKRAEVVQGASGRDEIAVIVDVQNIGYPTLKRITFDAWLYDNSGAKPQPVILASAADATPWHAFLRQAIARGQSAEVRLNYIATSKWSSDQAIALVNSGRYQIRLKAVSLTDDTNKSLGK